MKAIVNGQEMQLTYKKEYHNGTETIFECVNEQGVWVAVAESAVVEEKVNVRTAFEYCGDREGTGRVAEVKLTGKTYEEVEAAHAILVEKAERAGYQATLCANIEEGRKGKGFVIVESFGVESATDANDFKVLVYKNL